MSAISFVRELGRIAPIRVHKTGIFGCIWRLSLQMKSASPWLWPGHVCYFCSECSHCFVTKHHNEIYSSWNDLMLHEKRCFVTFSTCSYGSRPFRTTHHKGRMPCTIHCSVSIRPRLFWSSIFRNLVMIIPMPASLFSNLWTVHEPKIYRKLFKAFISIMVRCVEPNAIKKRNWETTQVTLLSVLSRLSTYLCFFWVSYETLWCFFFEFSRYGIVNHIHRYHKESYSRPKCPPFDIVPNA